MEHYNATSFVRKFPVGTVLTVGEFDDWAINEELINDPGTTDKQSAQWQLLLKQRNNIRASLNKIATQSELFTPQDRFSVEVLNYGSTYIVKPIADHFESQVYGLPEKVLSTFNTRVNQLKILMDSTDMTKLKDETRLRISMVARSTERLKRTITFNLHEHKSELEEIFADVQEEAKTIEGPTNGGFKAISLFDE